MSIIKVTSISELLDASNQELQRIHAAQSPAWLVVPSHEWAQSRKVQLSQEVPTGVDVLTYPQLISQLWELYGDGTQLIDNTERRVLLRSLVEEVGLLPAHPSPGLIDHLALFAQEAICIKDAGLDVELSPSESKIMEVIELYECKLELVGLTEAAQAEAVLIVSGALAGAHFVFEAPDLHSAHIRSFICMLDSIADVSVIEQRLMPGSGDRSTELSSLRSLLFTGESGLEPQGHVRVGLAHGAHASNAVIAQLAHILHAEDGIDYSDIIICPGNSQEAYPGLHDALAYAGIPFTAQFSLPSARTGLGAAFIQLETLTSVPVHLNEASSVPVLAQGEGMSSAKEGHISDDVLFEALVGLLCSPYSGVDQNDARALQMRWRERAHATHALRMQDIFEGFSQGNATASVTQERLKPLAVLFDVSPIERIELLFENAHASHVTVDTLVDDRAAAEVLLDYLEVCNRFSCQPDIEEMANLGVLLQRSYGSSQDAVRVASAHSLGLSHAGAVILADLDVEHYPMAAQGAPFDALMAKLDIKRADTLANDQRLMLLNAIEAAGSHFAFMRSTHDLSGDESCQSALFEELVSVYRTKLDADLPIQAVPSALEQWLFEQDEAGRFFAPAPVSFENILQRGKLALANSQDLLMHNIHDELLTFSPTALEDYYRCPYRWFASRRVGYNGMDASFDPASQGSLVHAVMQAFYERFLDAGHIRVTEENLQEALVLASSVFDAEVCKARARGRGGLYLKTRFDELVCEDMRARVLDLVERDAWFLPGFAPKYFELELGHKELPLQYASVPVRGKVDRIDVDQAGNAVIIDYKLSSLSAGYGFASNEQMPQRIQTDIYASLVQRYFEASGSPLRVIGSVYRSYASNYLRGAYTQGINWGQLEKVREDLDALPHEEAPMSYEAYLDQVENAVFSCMERLTSGVIEPEPLSDDACAYCKALSFCPRSRS